MNSLKALKDYVSLAQTEINRGESSVNQMVNKIHYLMRMNGHKVSKSVIKDSLNWDKLEWGIQNDKIEA